MTQNKGLCFKTSCLLLRAITALVDQKEKWTDAQGIQVWAVPDPYTKTWHMNSLYWIWGELSFIHLYTLNMSMSLIYPHKYLSWIVILYNLLYMFVYTSLCWETPRPCWDTWWSGTQLVRKLPGAQSRQTQKPSNTSHGVSQAGRPRTFSLCNMFLFVSLAGSLPAENMVMLSSWADWQSHRTLH